MRSWEFKVKKQLEHSSAYFVLKPLPTCFKTTVSSIYKIPTSSQSFGSPEITHTCALLHLVDMYIAQLPLRYFLFHSQSSVSLDSFLALQHSSNRHIISGSLFDLVNVSHIIFNSIHQYTHEMEIHKALICRIRRRAMCSLDQTRSNFLFRGFLPSSAHILLGPFPS